MSIPEVVTFTGVDAKTDLDEVVRPPCYEVSVRRIRRSYKVDN